MTRTVRLSQFEAMKKERDELAAHVERLRHRFDQAVHSLERGPKSEVTRAFIDMARKNISETPKQSLQEIRAEAIEGGFVKGCLMFAPENTTASSVYIAAKEHANQIRNGDD